MAWGAKGDSGQGDKRTEEDSNKRWGRENGEDRGIGKGRKKWSGEAQDWGVGEGVKEAGGGGGSGVKGSEIEGWENWSAVRPGWKHWGTVLQETWGTGLKNGIGIKEMKQGKKWGEGKRRPRKMRKNEARGWKKQRTYLGLHYLAGQCTIIYSVLSNVTCTCIQICGWAAGDVQLEDEEKNKLKLGGGGWGGVQCPRVHDQFGKLKLDQDWAPERCLETKAEWEGEPATITFKLLKSLNTLGQWTNLPTLWKKLQYVCSTVAKPCCRMGSFLEGLFGMIRTHDSLETTTHWCTYVHAHTHTHTRTHTVINAKTARKIAAGKWMRGGENQQLLTKTLYTTLNLIFCKIKHNND